MKFASDSCQCLPCKALQKPHRDEDLFLNTPAKCPFGKISIKRTQSNEIFRKLLRARIAGPGFPIHALHHSPGKTEVLSSSATSIPPFLCIRKFRVILKMSMTATLSQQNSSLSFANIMAFIFKKFHPSLYCPSSPHASGLKPEVFFWLNHYQLQIQSCYSPT